MIAPYMREALLLFTNMVWGYDLLMDDSSIDNGGYWNLLAGFTSLDDGRETLRKDQVTIRFAWWSPTQLLRRFADLGVSVDCLRRSVPFPGWTTTWTWGRGRR